MSDLESLESVRKELNLPSMSRLVRSELEQLINRLMPCVVCSKLTAVQLRQALRDYEEERTLALSLEALTIVEPKSETEKKLVASQGNLRRYSLKGEHGSQRKVPDVDDFEQGAPNPWSLLCDCNLVARVYMSGPSTAHAGKKFLRCAMQRGSPRACKFFLWTDQIPTQASPPASSSRVPAEVPPAAEVNATTADQDDFLMAEETSRARNRRRG